MNVFDDVDKSEKEVDIKCKKCGRDDDSAYEIILCDQGNDGYHTCCVDLENVPDNDWYCSKCNHLI